MKSEKFRDWLIKQERKKPGTGNAYSSAINKISEHYSQFEHKYLDIYSISNIEELDKVIALYDFNGKYFNIGEIGNATYRNALKALKRYTTNLPKPSSEEKTNVDQKPKSKNSANSNRIVENYIFDSELIKEAHTMSEYYEVFYCLEKTIRLSVTDIMKANYGDNWWNLKVNSEIKKRVDDNIKWELNTGYTERSYNEIDYTTFGDLRQIIKANWNDFSGYFKNQAALNSIMISLNTLRVPIAHCTPFAEDEITRLKLAVSDWFRQLKNI